MVMFGTVLWSQAGVATLLAGVCLYAAVWAGRATARAERRAELGAIAQACRDDREAKRLAFKESKDGRAHFPKEKVDEVTSLTASELAAAIKAGKYTSTEVMQIYCQRGLLAAEKLNVTAAEMFADAMAEARKADEEYKRLRGKGELDKLPPLHGVPVSIKDNLNVAGQVATSGMQVRASKPVLKDSAIVKTLRAAGAIPFVKGNIPQGLMIPESDNAVFGRALNPFNQDRTPGGSSGGDAALVAARCAPLSIGSDIGGSIRIPAHFCGIYGFKATAARVSRLGNSMPRLRDRSGQEKVAGVIGPMARSVADIATVLEIWWGKPSRESATLTSMHQADPLCPPLPFYRAVLRDSRPVWVGVLETDGWFETCPTQKRAIREAASVLTKKGHKLINFKVPDPTTFVRCYTAIMSADGGMRCMIEGMEGEAVLPTYERMLAMAKLPGFIRPYLGRILQLFGQRRASEIVQAAGAKTTYNYWDWCAEASAYSRKFMDAMREANVDALLMPAHALPAYPHGAAKDLSFACSYTFLLNLINLPAGVVPVTVATLQEEGLYSPPPEQDDLFAKKARATLKDIAGLPVGVQVATLPWRDELCLRLMQDLETGLGPCPRPNKW